MEKRLIRLQPIVLCIALCLVVFTPPVSRGTGAPVTAPAPLMQFVSGGHIIGFQPTQVIVAALDHALRIEFVGTAGVMPVAAGVDESALSIGPGIRQAQPLGVVSYPGLWRGVTVEYRASRGSILKSTYTVAPGADVSQIRLRYNAPVQLQSDGSLQFRFGRGCIGESAPIAWQEIDGSRVFVPVAFRVLEIADANLPSAIENGTSEIGFRLGAYDGRYPLTIDPNYIWHTFYGSSTSDYGQGIAVDASGNVYITGISGATWGSPLHAHSGDADIFVLKLNSAGAYQWHTFYGSSNMDNGRGIAVDASSNVYVTGHSSATWQGDGGTDPLHSYNGPEDIVVLKLDSAGTYQWHTFYGSSDGDIGWGIAVDASSNVYVTGWSDATWQGDGNTNPLHAYSGYEDIVALKLTSAGAYQWHTFYGSGDYDRGYDIAVDASSNVYITGRIGATWQGDGNTNPLHSYSGSQDIVVLKLDSAGTYQWHTFYGSSSNDEGYGIAVDGSSNVYVMGFSWAAWQGDGGTNPLHPHSGNHDFVVLKLNSAGTYQWHTFYGSGNYDYGYGIAVDAGSNVYVTGYSLATWQGDGGTNPLHPHSGNWDIVVLILTTAGAYQWHTFYGSSSTDEGYGIAVDGTGSNVCVTGDSRATWQGDGGTNPLHAYSGDFDIVALKLGSTSVEYRYLYLPMIQR